MLGLSQTCLGGKVKVASFIVVADGKNAETELPQRHGRTEVSREGDEGTTVTTFATAIASLVVLTLADM